MEQEIWKDIVGYEGYYQVSNTGRVRSLDRVVNGGHHNTRISRGKILIMPVYRSLYYSVALSKSNKIKRYYTHRLVASAFIPNPENKSQINHIDGDKQNNKVENLEWCTPSENNIHAVRTGLSQSATNRYNSSITAKQVIAIYLDERVPSVLAKEYNIKQAVIEKIKYNKSYRTITSKLNR